MIKKITTNQSLSLSLSLSHSKSIEIKWCLGGLIRIEDKQTFLSMAINGASDKNTVPCQFRRDEGYIVEKWTSL